MLSPQAFATHLARAVDLFRDQLHPPPVGGDGQVGNLGI